MGDDDETTEDESEASAPEDDGRGGSDDPEQQHNQEYHADMAGHFHDVADSIHAAVDTADSYGEGHSASVDKAAAHAEEAAAYHEAQAHNVQDGMNTVDSVRADAD